MADPFGIIADAMSCWSGPRLPPELRKLRGGLIGGTMERGVRLGLDGGIFEVIGGIPAQCMNPDAAMRRAMGEVSAAFYVLEEFRRRGIQIGNNIGEPLIRALVQFFQTLGDPRSAFEVRAMVETYLRAHSVAAPISVEEFVGVSLHSSPILTKLREIERECQWQCKRNRCAPNLDDVGLNLDRALDGSRYNHATPLNVRTFAFTGGDGAHFGLLVREGAVSEDSPVVIIDPSGGGASYAIAGENLREFLDFGYHTGYFCFGSLVDAHDRDELLRTLSSGPAACRDFESDFGHTRPMMQQLHVEFGLKPWADANRFQTLQARYLPLLVKPPQ